MTELSSAAGITAPAAATASVTVSISVTVTVAVIISFPSVSEADSVAFCKALIEAVSGRVPAPAVIPAPVIVPAAVIAAPVVPSPVVPVISASAAIRKAAHILKISFFSLIL